MYLDPAPVSVTNGRFVGPWRLSANKLLNVSYVCIVEPRASQVDEDLQDAFITSSQQLFASGVTSAIGDFEL